MACFTTPPLLLGAATRPRQAASSWLGRRPPHPPAAAATAPTPAAAPARLTMGVRAVPSYDGSFELADETRAKLVEQLGDPAFVRQVAANSGAEEAEFLGVLFQPVPYSPGTPRGAFLFSLFLPFWAREAAGVGDCVCPLWFMVPPICIAGRLSDPPRPYVALCTDPLPRPPLLRSSASPPPPPPQACPRTCRTTWTTRTRW